MSSSSSSSSSSSEPMTLDQAATAGKKAFKSSIALVPPLHLWDAIQELREVHDKHFLRWLPHVNLLYPFLEEAHVRNFLEDEPAELHARLRQHLFDDDADSHNPPIKPFRVKLDQWGHFVHGKRSATFWLKPEPVDDEDADAVHHLQARLQNAFPICDDLINIGDQGFQPHLSIGQVSGVGAVKKMANTLKRDFAPNWQPIEFDVTHVFFITRQNFDDPFRVRGIISLDPNADDIWLPVALDDHNDMNAYIMELNKDHLAQAALERSQRISSASSSSSSSSSSKHTKQQKHPHTQKTHKSSSSSSSKSKPSKKRNQKMRGAEDVISRIRWDPEFNQSEWLIGYEDRFTGIQWVNLDKWDEGLDHGLGSIPMHRIRQFKHNDLIVWDREAKIDHVFNDADDDDRNATTYDFSTLDLPRDTLTIEQPADDDMVFATTVTQWNILSNNLTEVFESVPVAAVDPRRRLALIQHMLSTYASDICTLQEVDELAPILDSLPGYDGLFLPKHRSKGGHSHNRQWDGCATLWNTSVYTLVDHAEVRYSSLPRPELELAVQVAQLILLNHTASNTHLVVVNTHLKARETFEHARVQQASALLDELVSFLDSTQRSLDDTRVIMACDLNAQPSGDVYALLTQGQVTSEDETFINPLGNFSDAYAPSGQANACAWTTHCHQTMRGTKREICKVLDYVLLLGDWHVNTVLLPPADDDVPSTLLPCLDMPSDHVPLVTSLFWTAEDTS